MKNLLFLLSLTMLLSCSGDDSGSGSDCQFVGKWCTEDPLNDGQCWSLGVIALEFRANGEFFFQNTTSQNWTSSDCTIIEIFNTPTGIKQAEYEVRSISENKLVIDIGTETELIRER